MAKSPADTSATPPDDLDEGSWTNSVIVDVNSLLAAEAGREGTESPLPMDENQMRLAASVFANSYDGIMITDAEGFIRDVNQAFTRISGYSREEALGRRANLLKSGVHEPEFYAGMWENLKTHGYWRGEVWNRRKNGELFPEMMSIGAVRSPAGMLTNYFAIYHDISALKESQQRLEHLAYYDALTRLPNRVLLGDRISQALAQVRRRSSLLAVCFLDLDDFKPVNDRYGHQTGDRLLIEVAQRLKDSLREGDTVARLGGDEFAILLTDLESPSEAADILNRLRAGLALPYRLDGVTAVISGSIGYTLIPGDNADPDALLRHADQAMYVAKQEGRNRIHLFDTEHDERVRSHRESVSRIQSALDNGEFRLYYQPKVNMRQGTVVGVEALIRWQHPEFGLLAPSEFLLTLGDNPLLVDIGDWAIRQALTQISAWRKAGLRLPVSVNISGRHLLHAEFTERLARHLAAFPGLNPRYLELEILETAALEDVNHVSRVIGKCREMGVEFALDDFGTGYSSLLYLKRLPAKTLKIDQSFVRDMLETPEGTDAIAGILALASAFKRKAVAEGVESVEQGIVLLRLNCDVGQGYGIARPMPADEVQPWVSGYKPDSAWLASVVLPWRRSDFPLVVAEVEQRRWQEQVAGAVERGDKVLPANRIGKLAGSRFGRWLVGVGTRRYGQLPQFQKIEELHVKAHRVAAEIGVRLAKGDIEKARELLLTHNERSKELVAALLALRIAVADMTHKPVITPPLHSTFGPLHGGR